MAAPIRPADSKEFGREKWVYVPTIAAIAAPTAAEVAAAGILDISMMLFDETGRPESTTNRPTSPMRVGDTITYEQIGITNVTGGALLFALDPQAAALANGVKAWEKFVADLAGFLVRRSGIVVATDLATGQFVDVFPASFGPPFPTTVGDGESKVNAFRSEFAITGPVAPRVAIVA